MYTLKKKAKQVVAGLVRDVAGITDTQMKSKSSIAATSYDRWSRVSLTPFGTIPRLLHTLRAKVRFVTLSKTPDWMLSIPFLIVLYDQVKIIRPDIFPYKCP